MKRALINCAVVALVMFLIVGGAFWYADARQRDFLLHHVDHRAVSIACLDIMTQPQYQPLIDQYPSGSDPRLPVAIRDVKAFWLKVSTNEIVIMKTGGHYHMGFVFHRSPTVSNAYELVFQEEKDRRDILLYTLPSSKGAPSTLEPTTTLP